MTHMTRVINGRSAGVPSDMTILHGHEWFLLAREGVAQQELTASDGVGGGDFGGIPWVTVGGVGADWLAEVACAGEGHLILLQCIVASWLIVKDLRRRRYGR